MFYLVSFFVGVVFGGVAIWIYKSHLISETKKGLTSVSDAINKNILK